ncbi:MAG: energy transducer TonB [Alphaproteobacteria bacterium]
MRGAVARRGLSRSVWPALLASFALHSAFAGLWALWLADRLDRHDDGQADAGVIEIVLASLPDAAPPQSRPAAEAAPAAHPANTAENNPSMPSADAPVPAAAVALGAPEPMRPKAAARPAMPRPPALRSRRIDPLSLDAARDATHDATYGLAESVAAEPAAGPVIPAVAPAGVAALDSGGGNGLSAGGGAATAPGYALGSSSNPRPTYPLAARYDGVEGRVMLRVRVDADGLVSGIDIASTSGHAILDRAAVETVSRWRFEPARAGGVRVPGEVDVPIQFRLRG